MKWKFFTGRCYLNDFNIIWDVDFEIVSIWNVVLFTQWKKQHRKETFMYSFGVAYAALLV